MPQTSTSIANKQSCQSLTAAEFNSLRSAVDGNATDAESRFSDYEDNRGWVDYNDTTGAVSLTANVWTDVPNNTLGSFTNESYKPNDISGQLIDDSTGYLDFTELDLGAEIIVRNDLGVVPTTDKALFQIRYLLGSGASEYPLLAWSERLDSGSGINYGRVALSMIYMGDLNTRDNPGKLQVKLTTAGTLTNNGSYITKKL